MCIRDRLYTRTGFHISFNAARLVSSETETRIVEFGWQQWIYLGLLLLIWLTSQLVISNSIWRRMEKLANYKFGPSFTSFFLTCFIASHGIHIWADAHLYQPIVKQDNLFPLSYPATAKTTMSRYGLLDLETYKQRKSLQFNEDISNIKYPSEPIYCGINKSLSALVLVQTDNEVLSQLPSELRFQSDFFGTASSFENNLVTSIFGVPEFYADTLSNKQPVLLALPQAQGMQVSVSYNGDVSNPAINHYKKSFSSFEKGIHIGYMTGSEIIDALSSISLSDTIVMVVSAKQGKDQTSSTLYTNLEIASSNASNEDIAPTILSALGCQSPIDNYSTGRNLINPEHNWIVSTSGERIIVIHNMQQIDVMSNGNYEIINLNDNTRSSEGLNIRLLSQAIKHLTRFSESQ